MCDRPSALYHRKNFDIVAANLDSHSGTRAALKIGDKDRNYLEIEWPEGDELIIRKADAYHDEIEAAKNEILRRAPNRDSFYILLRLQAARNGWHYILTEAEAKTYANITKAVEINLPEGCKAEFPNLTQVSGYVDVYQGATFTAPVLASVSGSVDVREGATFTAPVLASVSGYVDVYQGATFTAPVLASVWGSVVVREGATFTAPKLKRKK